MAQVIGVQSGAVSISSALSRPRSAAAVSTTCSLLNPAAAVKSLSSGGSKEIRGGDLAFQTRNSSSSRVNSSGTGAALQVTAGLTALPGVKWITDLFGGAQQQGSQTSVTYKGVAVIAKKRAEANNLIQFDLIDVQAALADKNAEFFLNLRIEVQLVSEDLDPKTNDVKLSAKAAVQDWVLQVGDLDLASDEDSFPINFTVPGDFGLPGAFIVKNNHPNQFYLKSLVLQGSNKTTVEFATNAWIYNTKSYTKDRVYLPGATPPGLKALRGQELNEIRGDGTGERKPADRIYDYDVYNDLGDPDKSADLARPTLGGSKDFPYPRRLRTGRPMTKADPKSESRVKGLIQSLPYIPSDEFFLRSKNSTSVAGLIKGVLQAVIPTVDDVITPSDSFGSMTDVKNLYSTDKSAVKVPNDLCNPEKAAQTKSTTTIDGKTTAVSEPDANKGSLVYLNQIFAAKGENKSILRYAMPEVFARKEDAWSTDDEFARQALAGINLNVIQILKVGISVGMLAWKNYCPWHSIPLPYLFSKLTVSIFQRLTRPLNKRNCSSLTTMTLSLPFLERTNADKTKEFLSYATRTISYLNKGGILKPVAIELSLPPTKKGGASSNKVFTPADADDHLWGLAKTHAATIDFNYHEVISHFTFTHGCIEPFIIATHRQLSALHPIHVLLKPYFKDTLSINAAARAALIPADGIIEQSFGMGKYAFQVGAAGYGAFWQFHTQALPQNLLSRGLAEPADSSYPGSVKLVIDDYPYAKDGLELWDAIYQYVTKYVDLVYQGSDDAIKADSELQAWWKEIVNIGHGDHKDADWWPTVDSAKNLVQTITTIAWIAGPLHAAVNFGQYSYAGLPLNKNAATRKFVPEKGSAEYKDLQSNRDKFLLETILTCGGTLKILTTLQLLVIHSVDEEYIGTRTDPNRTSDPKVKAIFSEFSDKVKAIEDNISKRNKDNSLPNRVGPAKVPYTLLSPTSGSGMTGKGVPNSVSI